MESSVKLTLEAWGSNHAQDRLDAIRSLINMQKEDIVNNVRILRGIIDSALYHDYREYPEEIWKIALIVCEEVQRKFDVDLMLFDK